MDSGLGRVFAVKTCIGYLVGDDAAALVNPVNCMGVIEPGLAAQFRRRWPAHHSAYLALCQKRRLRPGVLLITQAQDTKQQLIAFPARRHWNDPVRLEDIEIGLLGVRQLLGEGGIASIAVPPLGCGLGGLDWHHVRQRIIAALRPYPVELRLYEPIPDSTPLRAIA